LRRKQEFFHITKYARRYDRKEGKFIIDISYETAAPEPTERVVNVAEAFGLGLDQWEKFVVYDNVELKIGSADIVYITGDSGSGKSVLLKTMEKDIHQDMQAISINVADIKPEPNMPLIEIVGKNTEEALELLSKVGLNDAFLFLRSYEQLSDGQKYRYKITRARCYGQVQSVCREGRNEKDNRTGSAQRSGGNSGGLTTARIQRRDARQ
jgi:ABC-type ATPase with predicted acetyltransferase domain